MPSPSLYIIILYLCVCALLHVYHNQWKLTGFTADFAEIVFSLVQWYTGSGVCMSAPVPLQICSLGLIWNIVVIKHSI